MMQTKAISSLTRRDIHLLFKDGITDSLGIVNKYPYYGCLDEIAFLERMYDLKALKSQYDEQYNNLRDEIIKHRRANNDFEEAWVFDHPMLPISDLSKTTEYLDFLCEVFHPEVRDESLSWRDFLSQVNILLEADGYLLKPVTFISGREAYSWRPLEMDVFNPFSERRRKAIDSKAITIILNDNERNILANIISDNNELEDVHVDFGWTRQSLLDRFLDEIRIYYSPVTHDQGIRLHDDQVIQRIFQNQEASIIFDLIEFFGRNLGVCFEEHVNNVLRNYDNCFRLNRGEMIESIDTQWTDTRDISIEEGISTLLSAARSHYANGCYNQATEKMWDVFERLKTYFHPEKDKKKSANTIVQAIGSGNDYFKSLMDEEFRTLTKIGNEFSIRHFERGKYGIDHDLHYKYLYRRCLALVALSHEFLRNL